MTEFMSNLKAFLFKKPVQGSNKDEATMLQANYLVLAKHGLAAAA
jgi:hypothetical protein